uniref:Uncharacterized protein n=1 Tax=Arion vulgaris TaxID=1028688 RepID=A0A0B7B793_9EUPU
MVNKGRYGDENHLMQSLTEVIVSSQSPVSRVDSKHPLTVAHYNNCILFSLNDLPIRIVD